MINDPSSVIIIIMVQYFTKFIALGDSTFKILNKANTTHSLVFSFSLAILHGTIYSTKPLYCIPKKCTP